MKERAIDPLDEFGEMQLIRSLYHQDTTRFARRKAPIVQIVPVHRHERATQIMGETVVADVGRAAERFFFEHEEDVPVQAVSHVIHESGRHVRISVDSRTG